MADDTSPFETGDLEDLRFESPAHALTAACPTDGEVSPNAKVFVEHGFWRYDVTSGLFSWADSRFPGGRPISLEADQADIWEAIHPADRAGFQAFILRAASTGEACAQALRMQSRDGSWRMISNYAAAQTDSAGVVNAVHGVVMDVTELEICRTLAEEGNDIIIRTDSVGRITYISPSVEKVSGFTPLELTGQLIADILDPDAARAVGIAFVAALANPAGGQRPVQYKARHKDGRTIWLESRITPVIDHATGQHLGATDVARDVTRHRMAEANLERANILLNVIMDASPSGIVMVDNDGRVTSFNQTFADMWNLSPETLERAESTLALGEAGAILNDARAAPGRLGGLSDQPAWDEVETADGRWIDRYTVPVRAPDQSYLGRAWFLRDVTEHKHALAQAVRMARFDALTGLSNRAVLIEALDRAVGRARRHGENFALFYLDLDDFKDVNDTLGHEMGDQLLVAVAQRLRAHCHGGHAVARLGADEFAILVADAEGPAQAAVVAETLIRVIGAPYQIGGDSIHTNVCVGIELFGADAEDAATLLSHADMALYQAKSSGAGSYRFFSNAMQTDVRTRVTLAAELREAIETGQLFLVYQPAVSLATGAIVGMEALVRWRHPRHGVLGPDLFIPVAERMGLIRGLGRWVLHEAARQLRVWDDQGLPKIRMGVNVSALQFKSQEVLQTDIETALEAAGLPPWRLELELTESALIAASEAGDILSRLQHAGFRIAIDDFGTGYSSLDYLRRLPAHRIKIAQTFVRHLDTSPGDAAIIKATIGLARDLGMSVIAEGVETQAQRERLLDWGCGEAQGYYFDKALSVEDAADRLSRGGYAQTHDAQAA
jgi:diguanylate cyclase (GGDEF)-like protein/PAS domain S-box-containing protein